MEIDAPEVVSKENAENTFIFANVFNGDQHSHVTLSVADSGPIEMAHVREKDPKFVRAAEKENLSLAAKPMWRKLPKARPSTHLWKVALPGDLPVGTHRITITAKDRHGRIFKDYQIIRVE